MGETVAQSTQRHVPKPCRCCEGGPCIGYGGLCEACSMAVERFVTMRRRNLSPESVAAAIAWRERYG